MSWLGLGTHGERQRTPYICSTPEHWMWFSLELGHVRDMEMAKWPGCVHSEPKVEADVSLDSDSPDGHG